MAQFTLNGVEYKSNDKGNYFYKSTGKKDAKGNDFMMRIPKHVWEQAWDEYMSTVNKADEKIDLEDEDQTWYLDLEAKGATWDADKEVEERKDLQNGKDKETEDAVNGKKETKKVSKPRRPKDVAFEMDTIEGHITLTSKQVDFIKLLPTVSFWDNGLESALWCDCIADDIDWNPMSVGAMVSTLREKKLVEVSRDDTRKGKPKYMRFTVVGQVVAGNLGIK